MRFIGIRDRQDTNNCWQGAKDVSPTAGDCNCTLPKGGNNHLLAAAAVQLSQRKERALPCYSPCQGAIGAHRHGGRIASSEKRRSWLSWEERWWCKKASRWLIIIHIIQEFFSPFLYLAAESSTWNCDCVSHNIPVFWRTRDSTEAHCHVSGPWRDRTLNLNEWHSPGNSIWRLEISFRFVPVIALLRLHLVAKEPIMCQRMAPRSEKIDQKCSPAHLPLQIAINLWRVPTFGKPLVLLLFIRFSSINFTNLSACLPVSINHNIYI